MREQEQQQEEQAGGDGKGECSNSNTAAWGSSPHFFLLLFFLPLCCCCCCCYCCCCCLDEDAPPPTVVLASSAAAAFSAAAAPEGRPSTRMGCRGTASATFTSSVRPVPTQHTGGSHDECLGALIGVNGTPWTHYQAAAWRSGHAAAAHCWGHLGSQACRRRSAA